MFATSCRCAVLCEPESLETTRKRASPSSVQTNQSITIGESCFQSYTNMVVFIAMRATRGERLYGIRRLEGRLKLNHSFLKRISI